MDTPPTYRTAEDVLAESLADPAVRAEWDRTALARAVSEQIVKYRVAHRLSQTALARQLGMKQPALARLEAGDHEPSMETLVRLSRVLGLTVQVSITPATINIELHLASRPTEPAAGDSRALTA